MGTDQINQLPLDQTKPAPADISVKAPEQPKQPDAAVTKKEKFTPELCASTISKLPEQLQVLKACFAQPFDAFRKAFKDPAKADRVMAKEIDFAAQAMMANTYLITYATKNPLSLVNALKNVALTNSTLNPVLKQGYLVPFSGAITFMPSYMGLVDVLINNGLVRKIEAHPIFEGEKFEVMHGSKEGLFHEPNPWGKRDKENLKGCYYFAVMTDGTEMFDTMSVEEIEKIRKRAPSAKSSSPWDTDYIEMAKKGLALDTLIPTPKGFTTMGEIKVGDEVFNALGEITKVTSKSEVKHLPCYRVTFQNGDSFVCDHEHRWFAKGTSCYGNPEWSVMEAKYLAAVKSLGYPITTPKIKPVILPEANLPIPPYVLGYWLGNGDRQTAKVTCDKKDADEIASYISPFYDVERKDEPRNNAAYLRITSKGVRNPQTSLYCQLRNLKENEGKHIPAIYKRASIAQRIELVQGMCDSDGCVHKQRGRCQWGSINKNMAEDFFEVISSLGERVIMTSKLAKGYRKEVMYYEVSWQPAYFIPVKLRRKVAKCKERTLHCVNSIKSVERVESVPTQCIAVDSFGATEESDLRKSFAIGRGFYITHNTLIRRAFKMIPKAGISEDKIKALEAVFDYDEKAEQNWIAEQKGKTVASRNRFDEEEVEYEEIKS